MIPALGSRDRLIPEFKVNLVYRLSSKTAKTTQRNPALKNKTKDKSLHTHTPDHTSHFKYYDGVFTSHATFIHMWGFVRKRKEKCSKYKANASTFSCRLHEPTIC